MRTTSAVQTSKLASSINFGRKIILNQGPKSFFSINTSSSGKLHQKELLKSYKIDYAQPLLDWRALSDWAHLKSDIYFFFRYSKYVKAFFLIAAGFGLNKADTDGSLKKSVMEFLKS